MCWLKKVNSLTIRSPPLLRSSFSPLPNLQTKSHFPFPISSIPPINSLAPPPESPLASAAAGIADRPIHRAGQSSSSVPVPFHLFLRIFWSKVRAGKPEKVAGSQVERKLGAFAPLSLVFSAFGGLALGRKRSGSPLGGGGRISFKFGSGRGARFGAEFPADMSFRSIVRDVRESFGSLSRRGFEVRISGLPGLSGHHHRGKSFGPPGELHGRAVVADQNGWVGLPPELLRDVMKRLEEGESTWPSRKDVVACAAVCSAWREICKDIVQSPEFCGKLTFPVSLKQPGPRDGLIQCFIRRDKSTLTYYLYLCLSPAVLSENGKFLLAAKRNRRTTYTEYVISVDSKNISRSSNGYVGKMRSNFLGTKFIVYDTQPPYNAGSLVPCQRGSRRIPSRRVSPKVPTGSYPIAHVSYELNVLGTRGPRRMQCTMHSIPASAIDPEGVVPGQPQQLLPGPFDESFRSTNASSRFSIADFSSSRFSSSRFSDVSGGLRRDEEDGEAKERPLVLRNKVPRWHEQLQCWCLNFRGRVTVASVKNFQLTAAAPQVTATAVPPSEPSQPPQQQQLQPSSSSSSSTSDHEKVILQFGKVTKDMFTMDYRYPLSAFQAFAICLTSFDTKLACE